MFKDSGTHIYAAIDYVDAKHTIKFVYHANNNMFLTFQMLYSSSFLNFLSINYAF